GYSHGKYQGNGARQAGRRHGAHSGGARLRGPAAAGQGWAAWGGAFGTRHARGSGPAIYSRLGRSAARQWHGRRWHGAGGHGF
nr:hypothetical protein [Tanacetum cinerariifolium]